MKTCKKTNSDKLQSSNIETCKRMNCDKLQYHNLTKFCERHKCSHCCKEATILDLACDEHKNYDGGPYTYPDDNGEFRNKFK